MGPEMANCRCRDFTKGRRRQDAPKRDSERAVSSAPPTGIVERGMYARVAQEPGMESRCSAETQNEEARDTEPIGHREVGARRKSGDVGELAPEDPAERRSAPENRLVGGRR